MPLSLNPGKLGQIEVFEDDTHFLVRIHPGNRDRAKKIVGRQWDGDRKAWVYPKNLPTYEALVEEFRKDADSFDIRQPKTKRPPGIKPLIEELDNDDDYQLLDDTRAIEDIGESQEKMYDELEQIREMLGSLKDVAVNQSRVIEEMRGTQEETKKALVQFESSTQQAAKPKIVEILPEYLDLTKQKEIELLERTLILIACRMAKGHKFHKWVNKYKPLREPSGFVIKTHEFLKKQLGKLVEDESPHTKFYTLIVKARDENLIYRDDNNPADRPISILFSLNEHRNCFGHPDFDQWEEWSRSILYLMNLALVWPKVVMEEEGEND
ncbi:hypothetical protein [Calothrix sp. CCY 0018]|uniref:hypothetical protein n=1 Tax=Calothrix sp. CCY 0018 TaxID=3103864 RepID=UPI0039C6085F